ncbi:MAG TPA: hypothetical protein VLE43_16730 [Candidatus Saccharimonadia bacterium]|nr:hypothetical protein [Candidatus Saccharimonadia bacterium]
MKPSDSLKPDNMDPDQQLLEPTSGAQPALSQKEDSKSNPAGMEIFYDGREVYGGY